MALSFYKNSTSNFLRQSTNEIIGQISLNDTFNANSEQKKAWEKQICILQNQLADIPNSDILFEYSIPRLGGRIDNVILYNGRIFVLEFKVGMHNYDYAAIRQVRTYAVDLANFHEQSYQKEIIPILIATESLSKNFEFKMYSKNIYDVVLANAENLHKIFEKFSSPSQHPNIDMDMWINSRFVPTPTIVEAAKNLYQKHSVEDIKRHESRENLNLTTAAVQKVIQYSRNKNKKSICFITGVPGAGKTLAGLNIAIENQKNTGKNYSCFLSGNLPLVSVLTEALARDDINNNLNLTKEDARRKVKSFIQIIHHFRDAALEQEEIAPADNVVIFDEAQRAWNKEKLAKFMKAKKNNVLNRLTDSKRKKVLSLSEPELLIEYMNRRNDWAVIICLIGGGQDINDGEAGLEEWFYSIRRSYKNWNIFVSPKINDKEYIGENSLAELTKDLNIKYDEALHLSVSLRSFRSENVSKFIQELLDNNPSQAKILLNNIKHIYPIYRTRSLNNAKKWVQCQISEEDLAGNNKRYGLLASSGAKRLKADGIWVECKCKPEKWFLEGKNDIKSSYYMEDVATEFDIQGLEIDYAVIAWDANFRYHDGKFEYYYLSGSKWNKINKEIEKRYLKNAYRVLLTRAREGMIIFVPNGSNKDNTRLCEYYDGLWKYLDNIGVDSLDSLDSEERQ